MGRGERDAADVADGRLLHGLALRNLRPRHLRKNVDMLRDLHGDAQAIMMDVGDKRDVDILVAQPLPDEANSVGVGHGDACEAWGGMTDGGMTKSPSEGGGPVPATRSATAMPAVRVNSGCFLGGADADAGAGAGAGDAFDGSLG